MSNETKYKERIYSTGSFMDVQCADEAGALPSSYYPDLLAS